MRGVVVAGLGAALLAGCDDLNTIERPSAPMVLTGAQLADLVGQDPGRIVAFAHSRPEDVPTWTQIPVQVDQRRVVDFGSAPSSNTTPGTTGTVYGTSPIGVTALQYADPGTWVGADPNATFDSDDELVFMVEDAGGKPRGPAATSEPPGVVPGSGVQVQLDDPLGDDDQAWVYLFVSDGSLQPSAGRDYVQYAFTLSAGTYKANYKRADGPNPETSTVTTDAYRIGFGDRFIEHTWRVDAGAATGVDILDGNKNQFALDVCGRSNVTFADAEGAFVANIDGPVRAIRSYVGANSGPLTQRTHLLYREREDIVTDLRVHAIPAVMDFLDYSTAALGMTYRSSVVPGGVAVDGVPDAVGTIVPSWEVVHGGQGTVYTAVRSQSSIAGFEDGVDWFHRDQTSPPEAQCWGDGSLLGASGPWVVAAIPNTDPRTLPFAIVRTLRTMRFDEPLADPSQAPALASAWAATIDTPLAASVASFPVG